MRIRMIFPVFFGATGLLGIGYWIGQSSNPTALSAHTPQPGQPTAEKEERTIAYIYGKQAITLEEYGHHLVALYGASRMETYVNQRIIETAASNRGITVTSTEVDQQIIEDFQHYNINKAEEIRALLLTRYGKTLDEWRQETMRPRLLMAKMLHDQIPIAEQELKDTYENLYGEHVACQLIIWPKDQTAKAREEYRELVKGDKEFDAIASKQADHQLAAKAGRIEPIGHKSLGSNKLLEDTAFSLRDGEVSAFLDAPELGLIVMKRKSLLPPPSDRPTFEQVRTAMEKRVRTWKLEKEVPKYFEKLRAEAAPMLLFGKPKMPNELSVNPPPPDVSR